MSPRASVLSLLLLATGCGEDGAPLSATGTGGGILADQCIAGEPADPGDLDPDDPAQLEGDNGLFMDHCNAQGDLVEATCELVTECDDGPNPDCTTTKTGNVEEVVLDCSGRCQNASCPSRCPEQGDSLTYLETGDPPGDSARILNYTDGREYLCTLVNDAPSDDYDCTLDPMPDDATYVAGVGLFFSHCTGGNFGNIQTTEGCSYTCDIPPP